MNNGSVYTLLKDGDNEEKFYYELFIKNEFPLYEQFWNDSILPITRRPLSWDIKSTEELLEMGKSDNDAAIAILHRTILEHLIRVYEIRKFENHNIDQLIESITRLVAGLDVADELLQRYKEPTKYKPFDEKHGENARRDWRQQEKTTRPLRKYRNALIHGRARAYHPDSNIGYPKIGKESKYLDNRIIVHKENKQILHKIFLKFLFFYLTYYVPDVYYI